MNVTSIVKTIIANPRLLRSRKNIFLVSHMRGNTSLLSHLLGSHPEIDGYYEMHIGYYSWKSMIRQKLLYMQKHKFKLTSRYVFDKVLHNEHYIASGILTSDNSKLIIMVREPIQTVKSIVSLYRRVEPDHEYCNPVYAAEYYQDRLKKIVEIASDAKGNFMFVQADDIRAYPEDVLPMLGDWLGLSSPIPTTYEKFENTGKQKCGDSSEKMMSGKIDKTVSDYSDIVLTDDLLESLTKAYHSGIEDIQQCSA